MKLKNVLKDFLDGISAGLLIVIGCSILLACSSEGHKIIGAVLFSVALLCICYKGLNLFTGKVGFIPEKHDKSAVSTLLIGLLGNLVGTLVFGIAVSYAIPSLNQTAIVLANGKYVQYLWQALIRAIFCGVLMYLAVSIFKDGKTIAGIIFCIPVFILSGFEHSIADMGYFAIAREFSFDGFVFIMVVIVGNAIGGMLLPLLKLKTKKDNE